MHVVILKYFTLCLLYTVYYDVYHGVLSSFAYVSCCVPPLRSSSGLPCDPHSDCVFNIYLTVLWIVNRVMVAGTMRTFCDCLIIAVLRRFVCDVHASLTTSSRALCVMCCISLSRSIYCRFPICRLMIVS